VATPLATRTLPKDLKWQDCAVKIPDWRHRRGAFNLPRSTAATKLKHCSKAKQPSLRRSLKRKKKEKEKKLTRRSRQMLHPGKVQDKNLKPQHGWDELGTNSTISFSFCSPPPFGILDAKAEL
jgi:hypothetical protein